jgi:enoyl-CoA hydratase/carnithine racemase
MSDLARLSAELQTVAIERDGPLVVLRLHTDGGSLQWAPLPHHEIGLACRAIAQDSSVHVVIVTGTGDWFSGPRAGEVKVDFHAMVPSAWEELHRHGMELMDSILSMQAIVIAAVNGPAVRHAELALLSDIVICSDDAEFQDSAHFADGLTPGDGINVITPLLMGLNRSRYFHLTGQRIPAHQALEWGLVNEVVPKAQVVERARELAAQLLQQNPLILRHTRLLFVHELRKRMIDLVPYGLALEGLDVAHAAQNH